MVADISDAEVSAFFNTNVMNPRILKDSYNPFDSIRNRTGRQNGNEQGWHQDDSSLMQYKDCIRYFFTVQVKAKFK